MRAIRCNMINLLLLACFSLQDIKNTRCEVGCMRSGYDSGKEVKEKCACYDFIATENIIKKKLTLPNRSTKPGKTKESVTNSALLDFDMW